ncbi:MAG TPA: N-acetyl-gamma-glutamyl-phosphate reductase [Candidatus Dormibacteraeota bacterium]|nr:N-acetyl-gamma-glutamyl-phosphate reductase [Candidatus Dormibacteraeota bacterium]
MKAAIVGGAGYAGGELLRLLLSHPEIEVTQVTSERLGGKFVHSVHPHLRKRSDLKFQSRANLQPVDVLFLALPHGETSTEIDRLEALAPTIIDLSADFRLRESSAYPTWYGWEHPRADLLGGWVYALPELHREQIRTSDRLAAGGCLATAAILGLYPLTHAGVIDGSMPIVIEGKTGSSAGGAESGPASHHPHRSGEMRSFAPTSHRHTAEIIQELGLTSPNGHGPQVAFSATAVEAVRGILITAHVYLNDDLAEKDLWKIYRAAYANEPFMRIVKESQGIHRYPNPKILSGTNYTDVGFERDPHSRRVVVMSALDNLMKGAAGQAVQALNVRRGWDERTGLDFPGLYPI